MKISKEAKVGIIVFSGVLLLFWGVNYLKGKDFFSSQKTIYAVYSRVDGLAPSNTVQVNGLKIGLVNKITLLPDHSGKIVVVMHMSNDVKIPRNSTAQIFSSDLLGTKSVRLLFGDSQEDIQNGDTLKSDIQGSLSDAVSAEVAPIKMKAENLLSSLDSVTTIIRDVFNEETKENLKKSFSSISTTLKSVEHIAMNLDTMMGKQNGKIKLIFDNVESITSNLKRNNETITKAIDNFASISDTLRKANLAATIENTKKTMEQTANVFEKINKGKGSIGKLVNDDSLYINLNATARDLDALLKDLKANPKRYVHYSLIGGGKK